ncbi:bifunctional hydroxymethylpyrimidine kinase/phosphomethylpyrimidine kinase [Leucobacter sp. CSA1]|uniref:Bifunctional hydroxymethylpyrimidine kinase/phosphomethylpyrimidine kinase n=1 Tax=Leucobacter chromiisoli TaxID=2796471 RepID=A0A934Q7T7_9MICO|nr:PfkB family carbohydrate kinase [Leucobacter chromiisoli]MBK0418132.1 bifunctional hydroxymethylpyrimidine kinase/phosphomethylpyrimidine kinase [Leucobacter chromiisoli]
MNEVTIFAPSPTLTITVEERGDDAEIHLHAGGQGVWQARMLRRLGIGVRMCCTLTGEPGPILRHLLEDEGFAVSGVERPGRASAYVHDRRGGERRVIAETEGEPLSRHDLDELYGATLREGLEAGLVILSGPSGEESLPADTYRRLASDLREGGAVVVVDLAGERLEAALAAGVDVLKVSHEELLDDGRIDDASSESVRAAMRELRSEGAETVIVSRASEPLLLLDADGFLEIGSPRMAAVETRGAGDSLTAGVAAGMARGEAPREAVLTGAAAGALNVTRHGLGTGNSETIERLRETLSVRALDDDSAGAEPSEGARVSPEGLAALARPPEDDAGGDEPRDGETREDDPSAEAADAAEADRTDGQERREDPL